MWRNISMIKNQTKVESSDSVVEERLEAVARATSTIEKIKILEALLNSVIGECEALKQELTCISIIPIDYIDPYPNHPYYVENDEDMENMVQSIQSIGQLTPGTIRIKPDGRFELLSGHRRLWACRLAGLKTFRCEVLELSDEEAVKYMIEANRQRQKLRPGEKGQIYKLKRDRMHDRRNVSVKNILVDAHDNTGMIKSYLRLEYLIPEILALVDEGKMSLRPAAELSYLSEELQSCVLETIEYEQCLPSHDQAKRMKKMFQDGFLTEEIITDIMMEEKPNQRDRLIIRNNEILTKLPEHLTAREREEYITQALDFYEKHRRQ